MDELSKSINQHFLIRYKEDQAKKTKLIGAYKYKFLVGEKLAEKHFKKALYGGEYIHTFKLRRGLKIEFVSK